MKLPPWGSKNQATFFVKDRQFVKSVRKKYRDPDSHAFIIYLKKICVGCRKLNSYITIVQLNHFSWTKKNYFLDYIMGKKRLIDFHLKLLNFTQRKYLLDPNKSEY